MPRKIDVYLEEVGHYIANSQGMDDIILEVRGHIYDKANEEFGNNDDESIEKVLAKMAAPREMAAKYSQDQDIIAPYYRKHIIVYTAFLFFIALGVSVASMVLGKSIHMIPFMQGEGNDFFAFISGLPVTFFYYFGIVSLFFMIITKYRKVKPAWLGWALEGAGKDFGKPTLTGLVWRIIVVLIIGVFFAFQSEILKAVAQALGGAKVYVLPNIFVNTILALTGIDFIVYTMRILANTPVLEAAGAAFKLIVLAYIVRIPLGFENLAGLDSGVAVAIEIGIRAVYAIIVVITTFELIRWLMYSFSKKYVG